MYKVKKEFEDSVLAFFKHRPINMKFKELPQSILGVLFRADHPAVYKAEKSK